MTGLSFRRAAELNINLVAATNRSAAGEHLNALDHIVAVHERLPDEHAVTDYVREHLNEEQAATLVVEQPEVFRFRCREAQQKLDVGMPEAGFSQGGAV